MLKARAEQEERGGAAGGAKPGNAALSADL
jgi:hypothetical protein